MKIFCGYGHRKAGKLSDIKPQIDPSYSQNGFEDDNWVKHMAS